MEKKGFKLYDGKVCGVKVSDYGLEHGYLDYQALAQIVGDCILNNVVRSETAEEWEWLTGEFDGEIMQDYIISEQGYKFLEEYTDELVFYNERLDLFVWAVDHFGTAWSHVLTDIELYEED